jgi:glycosyltransferase involved in cell wall biosynthesis
MVKVLHAAVSVNPSPGVIKQMEWEQQAADELGIEWTCSLHTSNDASSRIIHNWRGLSSNRVMRYAQLRIKFYHWLRSCESNYDLVILRFSVHDPWQKYISKLIGYKIITAHHTKEEDELLCHSSYGIVPAALEKFWGRKTLSNSLGHIAVTHEILDYELSRQSTTLNKPIFVSPNSIITETTPFRDGRIGNAPEIIFIASEFSEWQGLDKLINALLNDNAPCLIHLVGKISAVDVERCKKDPRFIIHGFLKQEEIAKIMEIAWCGLSTLALERKGMYQACTLKVRDYLQAGIPVYSGHKDSGLPEDFPYYINGSVNLSDIISFAQKMKSVSRIVISSASSKHISKKYHLQNLYNFLNSLNLGCKEK